MDYKLVFIFILIISVVIAASLRKAGKVALGVIAVLAVVVGFAGYVVFVPSSSVSIWVSEKIAPLIAFDTDDVYEEGDPILTFKVLEEPGVNRHTTQLSSNSSLSDLKKASKEFIDERISAIIEKRLEGLEEEYILRFKDSYLHLIPGKTSFSIIKGEPPKP